jgi:mono/diheme cytochrome c family protein
MLRVPPANAACDVFVAFLAKELGTDNIDRAKTYMEDALRMTVHLAMSTPDQIVQRPPWPAGLYRPRLGAAAAIVRTEKEPVETGFERSVRKGGLEPPRSCDQPLKLGDLCCRIFIDEQVKFCKPVTRFSGLEGRMRLHRIIGLVAVALVLTFPSRHEAQSRYRTAGTAQTDAELRGDASFNKTCYLCHNPTGQTKEVGVAVTDLVGLFKRSGVTEEYVRQRIQEGIPRRMPAYKYTYTPEELNNLIAYLKIR